MTDEQLRAMARRVLEYNFDRHECDGVARYYPGSLSHGMIAEHVEQSIASILRDEMDREWRAANHLDDDPTQTIVIDT